MPVKQVLIQISKYVWELNLCVGAWYTAKFIEPYYWDFLGNPIPFSSFVIDPTNDVVRNSIVMALGLLFLIALYLVFSYFYDLHEIDRKSFNRFFVKQNRKELITCSILLFLKFLCVWIIAWDVYLFWGYLSAAKWWEIDENTSLSYYYQYELVFIYIILFSTYILLILEPGLRTILRIVSNVYYTNQKRATVSTMIRFFLVVIINLLFSLEVFFYERKFPAILFLLVLILLLSIPVVYKDRRLKLTRV